MTRYRCTIVDEAGVGATRVIDARNRDQAVLLLLAEGFTPSSITRDAPSLTERIAPPHSSGAADILLQELARLAAAGFTIAEAAAAIDGERARRIAAGAPLGEVLADAQGLPHWIGAAFAPTGNGKEEQDVLIGIADDASAIALRRTEVRGVRIEAMVMAAATAALIVAVILIDVTAALALSAAIYLVLRTPVSAFRRSLKSIRQANFLLIAGRLMSSDMAPSEAFRIAAQEALADEERGQVDAALAARSADDDVLTDVAIRLGLSSADRAMMTRGEPVHAARAVSIHLARSSAPALVGLLRTLRIVQAATAAIILFWLISR